MTPCKFTFDATPSFDGFALGTIWNGFDNISVTPEVRDQIVAYFRSEGDNDTADSIASIDPDKSWTSPLRVEGIDQKIRPPFAW